VNTLNWNTRAARRLLALNAALALGAIAIAGCNNSGGGTSTGGDSTVNNGPLATVGAEEVTRGEFYSSLEASHGNDALVQLIDYHLLMQKAQADGIAITDDEVTAGLAERQQRNPQIASVVAAGGPRLDALRRDVRLQLAAQKLLTADIKATDAQLKAFMQKYEARWYDEPERAKIGALFSSTKVRADLMAQQLKSGSKTFAQLVSEQQKAKDPAAQLSSNEAPTADPLTNFPPAVQAQLKSVKVGSTTAPTLVQISPQIQAYTIFRVIERLPAQKADFAKLKPTVELDYKLAKVAENIVKQNPRNPPFDQAINQTAAAYFGPTSGNSNPKLRDVLTYITQFATNQLVAQLRASGQVTIEDTNYAPLADVYKPAGGAAQAPAAGTAAPGVAPAAK
jgi:hypothetical protein